MPRAALPPSPFAELARLLVPLACAGCGRPDVVVCRICARELAGPPVPVESLPAPVWSLGPYEGRRRALILAWKSGDRRDLRPVFERAAASAGRELGTRLPAAGPVLFVVPAASGLGRRLSGNLVVADAAGAVAAGLSTGLSTGLRAGETPAGCVVVLDLLVRAGHHSQAGRGALARSRARRGRVGALARLPDRAPVLLVDDVLASGATLAASCEAVAAAGGVGVGAVVLAHAAAGRGRAARTNVSPLEHGAR